MKTQDALRSLPPKDWLAGQIVVFDWFDGPRQGVARMANPECEFAFELLAEKDNPEGLDDRLFRVSELPDGAVAKILHAIRALGNPTNVVWVPVWKFVSEEERLQADQEIDRVLSQQKNTELVISSRDMTTFLECWEAHQVHNQLQN